MKQTHPHRFFLLSTVLYVLASAGLWALSLADYCGFLVTFTYFAFLPLVGFLYSAVICAQNTPYRWFGALLAVANQLAFPLVIGYLWWNMPFLGTAAGFVPLLFPLLGILAGWMESTVKAKRVR